MTPKLCAITLNANRLSEMLMFYSQLGWRFAEVQVDKGGKIHRANLQGIELCLREGGSAQKSLVPELSFQVEVQNLNRCLDQLLKIKGVELVMGISEMPFGQIGVVTDPDGHVVELVQH